MPRLAVASLACLLALAGCLGAQPASNSTNSSAPDEAPSNATAANGTGSPDPAPAENESKGNGSEWSNGTEVASGHILVGSPTTYVCSLTVCAGQEEIESFRMDEVPPPGYVIGTNTTDNAGAGFNLDLYFHDANDTFLGGCTDQPDLGAAGEQTCEVPDDAASGTVDAVWGADLDVVVEVVDDTAG